MEIGVGSKTMEVVYVMVGKKKKNEDVTEQGEHAEGGRGNDCCKRLFRG